MKDSIEVIIGIAALIGTIYGVFKVESFIYKSIDNLAKQVHDRINSLDRDLALHVAIYLERKEQVNLHLRGLEEKIDHAKSRLLDEIKELKAEVNHKRESDEN